MSGSSTCARLIVDQLIGFGVTEAVLAPGSRSAPLAYALLAAERAGHLRLHVRIDERSAAFLALGLAKASQRPVPVVTTSGTAAANLHPAALEAWHSGVPLVLITADRPASMVGTGANQTTVQRGLFAAHVRAEVQLDAGSGAIASWRHQLAQLLTSATGARSGAPGPVHLNAAFGEPLLPETDGSDAEGSVSTGPTLIEARTVAPTAVPLEVGPSTVVVVGDAIPEVGAAAVELAARARLPLFAEPSSNARAGAEAIGGYRLLLGSPLAEAIERVIVFGHPTLSRPVQRLLGRPGVELIVVAGGAEWVDSAVNAARVVDAVSVPAGAADEGWLDVWRRADEALQPRIEELVGIREASDGHLSGPALARTLWRSLGADDVLVVGSSNPIRDLELAGQNPNPPTVHANRGLAGIDGSVSTAIGIALALGRPTHALLGDLTFLHDSNGLIIGPAEPRPDLRIVVASDNGGSIFSTLEQGAPDFAEGFERLFGTPHDVDLAGLVASAGVPFRRLASVEELGDAFGRPPVGLEVVEVPVDRSGRRALDQALRAAGVEIGTTFAEDLRAP